MNKFPRQLVALALFLAAGGTVATDSHGDYADAVKAYNRGDFEKAYREYMALAEAGDVRAQGTVACMTEVGEGVPSDPAKAFFWYLKAAERGLQPAQFSLGRAYENGVGTERDLVKALTWYGIAAEKGSGEALASHSRVETLLASQGKGDAVPVPVPDASATVSPSGKESAAPVEVRKEEASRKAVVASVETTPPTATPAESPPPAAPVAPAPPPALPPVAAPALAAAESRETMPELVFDKPTIGQKRRAAERGDAEAQQYLGWCYSTGTGVAQNKSQAVKWYELAALSGRRGAQAALGWMYYSGEAGRKDLRKSAKWYGEAALQGDAKSKKMLKRIEKELARR